MCKILKPVVPLRCPVVQTVVYQLLAVDVQLGIVYDPLRVEAQLDLANRLLSLLEAGHRHPARGVHHLDQHQYLVLVLPHGLEPSK